MVAGQLLPPMTRPLRVLHCPEVVGGMPGELARAERRLGADSRAVAFENSIYEYPIDEVLYTPVTGRLKRSGRLGLSGGHSAVRRCPLQLRPDDHAGPDISCPVAALGMLLRRLYAGLFELRDVALLKRLGKAVFVTFQGDDLRQGDFCERHFGPAFSASCRPGTSRRRRMPASGGGWRSWPALWMGCTPSTRTSCTCAPAAKFLRYGHIDPRHGPQPPRPRPRRRRPARNPRPDAPRREGTRFVLEAVDKLKVRACGSGSS